MNSNDDGSYKFKFSVVMAVYNVENYLNEAIDSLINQSIGFKDNVQLILVNDGSTDNSLVILEQYQSTFPENIVVITQENNGQASARNNGLDYVEGKYVNFLDSDDYLEETTFEEVFDFFENHQNEVDIVAMPLQFFDRMTTPHVLNYKFETERVIDLEKEPNNPQLSSASAFFKSAVLDKFRFPTNIIFSEDVVLITKILLENKHLGVINSSRYFYRKRFDNSSTIDTVSTKKEYYIDKLRDYFLYLIDYAKSKEGKVPDFLQYTLIYDLQWVLEKDLSLLDDDEIDEFYYYLDEIMSNISVNCILNNPNILNFNVRNLLLYLKEKDLHTEFKDNNVFINAGQYNCDRLSIHKLWLDIVDLHDGILSISGFLNSLFDENNITIEAIKEKNNSSESFLAKKVYYTARKNLELLSKTFEYKYNFDIVIPVSDNEESKIRIRVNYHKDGDVNNFDEDNLISLFLPIDFTNHAKLSSLSNYKFTDSNLLLFFNNTFQLIRPSFKNVLKKERRVLKSIKDEINEVPEEEKDFYKYSLFLRTIYFLSLPLFKLINRNKQIYLFEDRIDVADDNAAHLFAYSNTVKDNVKKYFVLSKDSKQFEKVSKMGSVLVHGSFKHKIMMFHADKIISSHPYESVVNPFYINNERLLYDGLLNYKLYFLQHGVTLGNISSWLSKFDKNLSLITTVSDLEYDSFLEEGYGYDESIVQKLGFPRFDNLQNIDNKQILVIPTWRKNLRNFKTLFTDSNYFKNINSFLNHPILLNLHNQGFKIVFKPHWELTKKIEGLDERYIDLFDIPSFINMSYDDSYQDLFNNSSILITDYSSVFFDFAYLKKPIIYYQPDNDYHYDKGYFDFDTMGFGDVVDSEEKLVNKLNYYFENDFRMEKEYLDRVDDFFIFTDKNNCKRVYEWIFND